MSEKIKHNNPAYISHVHLKGYKSILDTEVELHPGLNIIIGPNGSGNTNFLEFLYKIGVVKFEELPNKITGNLNFYFQNDTDKHIYHFKKILKYNEESKKVEPDLRESLKSKHTNIDSEIHKRGKSGIFFFYPIPNTLSNWYQIQPIIIRYELPKGIQNLSQSLSFTAKTSKIKGESNFLYTEYTFKPEISSGIRKILEDLSLPIINRNETESLGLLEIIINNLQKFSPIKSVRIMPKLDLVDDNSNYRADFLNFEFYVEENWLTWNQLSDGTKRLFYIISEVTLNKGLCLVEEPELGAYPEQLGLIMMFLKEQAKEKQIIITTHAPRTLDFLSPEELNRIIITKFERKQGAKMRHLSQEDIQYIIEYNEKEGYTSDLWTMTDFFEDEEETV